MSFAERTVTQQDRRSLLQSLSSRLQIDNRIFELEERVYNQNKNDIHQYTLLVNQEANRMIQQQRSQLQNSNPQRPMQQNPNGSHMGSMQHSRMSQNQNSMPSHLQNPVLSQRQNSNPMYPSQMQGQIQGQKQSQMQNYPSQSSNGGGMHYSMQQRGNSMISQSGLSSRRSPPIQGQMQGMYTSNMQPQQPQPPSRQHYNQYPPAPPYMQSMNQNTQPSGAYPSYNVPQQQSGYGGPSGGTYTSYPSAPPTNAVPTSYPSNNITYRQPDRVSVPQATHAAQPTVAAPRKQDNIEEFKNKANDMKAKYLTKLNEMIRDVDQIKSEDTQGPSGDNSKQYDEIQKKLTLLKTLITADFKPNSNFPPRKEILEAAEKQIAMWIKEWDKLMRFANGNTQNQTGQPIDLSASGGGNGAQFPKQESTNGSSQGEYQTQVPKPPAMVTNFDFNQSGFDDINALLDLDNLGNLDEFSLMQGSVPQSSTSTSSPHMGQIPGGNSNLTTRQSNEQNFRNQGGDYSCANHDNYGNDSYNTGNDSYQGDNPSVYQTEEFGQDRFQNSGVDSGYPQAGDNYQGGSNTFPNGGNYSTEHNANYGDFSSVTDDKSNLDTFDDLDCGTDYLPNTNVLGKRKGDDYFETEQPSKYSKTEPM